MKVKTVNKINTVGTIRAFSLVLIFGIIFSVFALWAARQDIPADYAEVEAKIARIEEVLSPTFVYTGKDPEPDDYEHHVFVQYSYNGETYGKEYGRYSSSMKEGDTVILYLDPDDPAVFMRDPAESIPLVIAGFVVVLIGVGGLVFCICKKRKRSVQ